MILIDYSDTVRYVLRNDSVSGIQKVVYSTLGEDVDVQPCIIDWETGDVYVPIERNLLSWDVLKSLARARRYSDYRVLFEDLFLKFIKIEYLNFKGHELILLGGPWNFKNSFDIVNSFARFNKVKVFIHDLIPFYDINAKNECDLAFRIFFENLNSDVKFATSNTRSLKDINQYLDRDAKIIPFPHELKIISGNWSYNGGMNELERDSYFLSLGSIDGRKDHASIVNYWIDSGMVNSYKLFIVGAEKVHDSEFYLAMSRVTKNIYYLGVVDDVMSYRLMMSCCAMIYPSRVEGFGLPVLEAYSHKKKIFIPFDSDYKAAHCQYIEYNDNIAQLYESNCMGEVRASAYGKSWKEFVLTLKEL